MARQLGFMDMDIWWKAVGTAVAMTVVILTARLAHRRLAGLVAAFPTVTAPALLWLAHDEGPAFAAAAAVATVASCVMQAGFAVGYARAARVFGPAGALACGLAGAGAAALLALPLGDRLPHAAVAAAVGITLCRWLMPAVDRGAAPRPAAPDNAVVDIMLPVGSSAVLSTLAASLGAHSGPYAAGLLASLPVVGVTVAMVEQARYGPHAAGEFLNSYVDGLFGRLLFGTGFALSVAHVGAAWGLLLAVVCSVFAGALAHRLPAAARRPAEAAQQA